MSVHQIVYTYCEEGLLDGKRGNTILALDRGFPLDRIPELSPVLKSSSGETSFLYKPFGSGYVIAQNTPLEDGEVSHLFLDTEEVSVYPCEYIASASFMPRGVELPKQAAYIDASAPVAGSEVTLNKVMNFLAQPGRYLVFKSLFDSVLRCRAENRRVLICDECENIVMWISAVLYALPLNMARTLSFCTYCSDDVGTDISGIGEEGLYALKDTSAYSIFNLFTGGIPDAQTDEALYDFYEAALLHDYSLALGFHDFITSGFDYTEPDINLTVAYDAWRLAASGIASISCAEFLNIIRFIHSFSGVGVAVSVAEKILSQRKAAYEAGAAYLSELLAFLCRSFAGLSFALKCDIRDFAVEATLSVLCARAASEDGATAFFKRACSDCAQAGFSLPSQLMREENRGGLIGVLKLQPAEWKTRFMITLLDSCAAELGLTYKDYSADSATGEYLAQVMSASVGQMPLTDCARIVLAVMSRDARVLCAVYLICESVFKKYAADETDALLDIFRAVAAEKQAKNGDTMYRFFMEADRIGLVWALFSTILEGAAASDAAALYDEHYRAYFSASDEYCASYLSPSLELYYRISSTSPQLLAGAERYIFEIINSRSLLLPSSQKIVDALAAQIPLKSVAKDDRALVWQLHGYTVSVLGKTVQGQLLYLCFGVHCTDINNRKDFSLLKPSLAEYVKNGGIDLTSVPDEQWRGYFEWVLPHFTQLLPVTSDAEEIYGYFKLSHEQTKEFLSAFIKVCIKDGKNESRYTSLCEFLRFMLRRCDSEDWQPAADQILRLSDKRIEILRADAEELFTGDEGTLDAFDRLLKMKPEETSFFAKLFRKK